MEISNVSLDVSLVVGLTVIVDVGDILFNVSMVDDAATVIVVCSVVLNVLLATGLILLVEDG